MRKPSPDGVASPDLIRELGYVPSKERLRKGPVAIFECVEPIPCDVCVWACPLKAVSMGEITEKPVIDFNKCIGCGICVGRCPGQAIFVVDLSKDPPQVTVPYEMGGAPAKGEEIELLNRVGEPVGRGRIVKFYKDNLTYVVTVEVPSPELVMEVRAVRPMGGGGSA